MRLYVLYSSLTSIVFCSNDTTDRIAVGLIVRVLWAGIITEDEQVAGVGSGVRACRPEVAVRTLTVGSSGAPGYVA